MVRRQWISAVWVAFAAHALCASAAVTPAAAFRREYAVAGNGRVTVQNLYGNVSIAAWDRNAVLVEAIQPSADARRAGDAHIIVEPSAGALAVRTEYSGSDIDRPASVELRLTVPRGIRLENVLLTNGQLSLSGLSGPVKASAINGDICALKLAGQVELSTVNGKVEADFERIDPANPISLSSVNGAIRLTIPAGTGASLEAHNRSGGIASDVGRVAHSEGGHRLIVRGVGPQIRLHNVNGGISIHSAERPCT